MTTIKQNAVDYPTATMPSPDFRGFCFNKALFLKQRSSEMFNTERVPVKVYRWDDAGAPKLTTDAGAFKTVLKACLVTGYGEGENRKEPLGWEIHQETETAAYFRSKDKKSAGAYLLVNGDSSPYYDSVSAKFKVLWDLIPHTSYSEITAEASNAINELYCKYRREWILIGNNRAFWLIAGYEYERYDVNTSVSTPCATALFFGDFPSSAPHDISNLLLMSVRSGNYSLDNSFAKSSVFAGSMDDKIPTLGFPRSLFSYGSNTTEAVDSISKQLIASPFYIFQNDSLRGMIPGLLGSATAWYSRQNCFEKYQLDNSMDEFLIFTTGYNDSANGIGKNFLINMTAWEM